ncbi:MAG: hypothetical protein ACI9HK_004471, partial [Pirellulaceae bacterium]
RLFIYVDFNGMTRMRVVGLFGMSAVVVGFILVLYKIARGRKFLWLIRGHLWTLAIAIFLYALTPVDLLVTKYNVTRILTGDPAPSVQISVHPISSEGVLQLFPLLDCENKHIRDGVRAMLASRHLDAEELAKERIRYGWTMHQISDEMVLQQLRGAKAKWAEYESKTERGAELKRFHKYAYRWY